MTTKTQILTNIVLTLCFAFTAHMAYETNKKVKRIQGMFELIELRDKMYVEARMQFLEKMQNEIDEAIEKVSE